MLDYKLALFDKYADDAIDDLIRWLTDEREYLKTIARGRHAWGHYRYGDEQMYEYDAGQLRAEQAEELADAIVYGARRFDLLAL